MLLRALSFMSSQRPVAAPVAPSTHTISPNADSTIPAAAMLRPRSPRFLIWFSAISPRTTPTPGMQHRIPSTSAATDMPFRGAGLLYGV